MKTAVDARLRDEAARFSLRHRCDDCVHFDGATCGEQWPTTEHRLPIVSTTEMIVFCKEFESA